jgi:hypothetical protein
MKFALRAALRTILPAALALALAGCPAPPTRPAAGGEPASTPATAAQTPGKLYRIVPEASEVRILVYRSGSLARLGHNHVITSHNLIGSVTLPENATDAHFEIMMPVVPLAVDEPEERAEEGADFSAPVSDAARAGTHKNMMRPEVLDGDLFPAVAVRSTAIARAGDDYEVSFQVDLKGATHALKAPVHLALEGEFLTATGEFTFKQTDLGMTPFTAALGALAVQDELHVKFRIRAGLSAG